MTRARTVLYDVACVVAFVAIGRRTHEEAISLSGFLTSVWPFLFGLGVAHAALYVGQWVPQRWPAGIWVALVTGVVGLSLRAVMAGSAIAVPFAIVTAVVLFASMLGWRLLGARFAREPLTP